MNAKMMITDFCIKVPRAPVRRNTIMKAECYDECEVGVWSNPAHRVWQDMDRNLRSCQMCQLPLRVSVNEWISGIWCGAKQSTRAVAKVELFLGAHY